MTRNTGELAEMEGTPPTFEELQKDNPLAMFYNIAKLNALFGAKRLPEPAKPEDSNAETT